MFEADHELRVNRPKRFRGMRQANANCGRRDPRLYGVVARHVTQRAYTGWLLYDSNIAPYLIMSWRCPIEIKMTLVDPAVLTVA